ncbi:hypothetical protein TBLA_0D05640 [Henningerozyma blattae CBS 6284]|uniref:mitogen-activated protein kinase kinase n=1 Tax=Henningerozyma blattae (strain ATCC 34711 / CBS 6284 / DSM 70876 / NBRC 10599 / NRRL Y-10934 / UCD 77-7) TaxID=1071380 RepID=I2H3V4_HENB6|nr:hypothetical protein TBLA_0D05640 [Tetrapisispora blattae CBS 6284]CCH61056.1 hypothetical protein TBLA_0D05640 [Tetrapisispora blattae CBS 6284]
MSDQFAKLTLEGAPHDRPGRDSATPSPSTSSRDLSPGIKRAQSTSSQYSNINANFHARMKAFQEQRSLKRSASVGSQKNKDDKANQDNEASVESDSDKERDRDRTIDTITSHNSAPLENQTYRDEGVRTPTSGISQKIVNKPLPPLPGGPSNLPSINTQLDRSNSGSGIHNISNNSNSSTPNDTHVSNINVSDVLRSDLSHSISTSAINSHMSNRTFGNDNDIDTNKTNISTMNINVTHGNRLHSSSLSKAGQIGVNDLKLPDINKLRQQRRLQQRQQEQQNKVQQQQQNEVQKQQQVEVQQQQLHKQNPTSPIQASQQLQQTLDPNSTQFNPNRRAPKRPITMPQVAINRGTPATSLSARRGLKLPPGGLSLKSLHKSPTTSTSASNTVQEFAPSPSNKKLPINSCNKNNTTENGRRSNPGSLLNAIQSTSTSSSVEQHDTLGTEPRNSNSSGSGSGSGSGGLFANFSKYVDIKSGSLNFAGKLSLSSKGIDFSNGYSSRITLDELEFLSDLGHGNYGNVSKVLHKPTQVIMAMKEVRLELDEAKFRQILMELEVLHKCQSPYIVDFYGAFFIEGAVYMCMEYMDGSSLDKIYDITPEIGGIDEPQLAFISNAVIRGLRELKDVHNIIHRDVKPTNILCSATQGTVKLCDFGVSGNLVASMAKTNIGCQSYMAPERIKSLNPDMTTYSVQSDVWSLGLSILEMALGRYPYPPETFDNIFSQLSAIVDGPPPTLPLDRFSKDAYDFVAVCLRKNPERRPTYSQLLEHPWLLKYNNVDVGMSQYISDRLEKRKRLVQETGGNELPKIIPALHMGGLP